MLRRLLLAAYYIASKGGRRLRDGAPGADGARFWVRSDDYIGSEIAVLGGYELPLLAALRDLLARSGVAGTVMLDVGANVGHHSVRLRDLFDAVLSFEPNPEVHDALRLNLATNRAANVTALPYGLADRDDVLPFGLDDANLGGSSFAAAAAGDGDLQLEVRRGDVVVAEHLGEGRRVGFVKIDVEGFEELVVSGLAATIERDRPVIGFEFDGTKVDDWFTGHGALAGYRFHEFGYRGVLRPLDRVRGTAWAKALELVAGHRKTALRPLGDAGGHHHPMVVALPARPPAA